MLGTGHTMVDRVCLHGLALGEAQAITSKHMDHCYGFTVLSTIGKNTADRGHTAVQSGPLASGGQGRPLDKVRSQSLEGIVEV